MHGRVSQRGTTLIELVASIVIVSIALFGLMLAISAVVGRSADPMIERQALAIAEAYLEEATHSAFCDPDFLAPGQQCRVQCTASACSSGACGGIGVLKEAARPLYDDVCDYDGIADAGARDRNGNALAGLAGYAVAVDVVDDGVTLGNPAIEAASGALVRVDVTVSHSGLNDDIVLSAFRANTQ